MALPTRMPFAAATTAGSQLTSYECTRATGWKVRGQRPTSTLTLHGGRLRCGERYFLTLAVHSASLLRPNFCQPLFLQSSTLMGIAGDAWPALPLFSPESV